MRYSVVSPSLDLGFVEDARKRFVAGSAYLDDRPTAPLRFLAEANLTQIIRRYEQLVDKGQARTELNDEIKQIFSVGYGQTRFQMVPFPSTPAEAPDDANDGRPYLHVMSYDGVTVGATVEAVPELLARIFDRKGQAGSEYRAFRNHLVFLVADESRKEDMKHKMVWRLALRD